MKYPDELDRVIMALDCIYTINPIKYAHVCCAFFFLSWDCGLQLIQVIKKSC